MEQAAGVELGQVFATPSKTLTDAHFLFFSGLTGDNHPIHYDVEYAKTTKFGKPLAHGLLLASMTALGATDANSRIDGFVFVEQGSRFLKPALVGDTIRPEMTVEKIWKEGARQYVRFATLLRNQRDEILLEGFHVYQIVPGKNEATAT
ncbi:MAG: MaoC family dehydratase [Rickettsiales bacterium]|jgi:3-hydroxybutyryl-CoA dehydratase